MAISFSVLPPLKFLPAKTPTVPPPPDLSDGTPVYLYAVIWTSGHCSWPDANVLTILLQLDKLSIKKQTICRTASVNPNFWRQVLLKLSITDILTSHVDTAHQ